MAAAGELITNSADQQFIVVRDDPGPSMKEHQRELAIANKGLVS